MSDGGPSRRVALTRLALSAALFFALPLVFLVGYAVLMHAPANAIGLHLHVVAVLALGIAGARLLLSFLPITPGLRRILAATLLCSVALASIALYAGSFIGLTYWGRVATVELASTYVAQAPALLGALGYPVVPSLLAGALVPLLGIAVAYGYLLRFDWVPAVRAHLAPRACALLAVGLVVALVLFLASLQTRDWGRHGEPLSLALYPSQASTESQSHGIDVFRAAQLQREDDAVRRAYAPSAAGSRSNVILIVVDALRADRLSLLGYGRKTTPYLERVRDGGAMVLATSAVTTCNESACGLHALASSRYVDRQVEGPMTVHEVLKRHGYKVHLLFSGDHVNFYGLARIYGPVDSYFDGASQTARYINDDRLLFDRLGTFSRWDGTPVMLQFHLMSAHPVGERFAQTPEFGPSRNYLGYGAGAATAEMLAMATNHYDRGVLQTDRVIDELLSRLGERGYLENAVVVITGDHGEALGERGHYGHSRSVWDESLRVPFIVLAFGKADTSKLPARPVTSQVDIAPSLLRRLGMPLPQTWQGIPLQQADQRRFIYFQQGRYIGLVDQGDPDRLYKHWVDARSGEQFTFDLVADPGERSNITGGVPLPRRQAWRTELLNHAGALPPELRESLRRQPVH